MKKALLLFWILTLAESIWAYDFKADKLYYKIITDTEVEVTYQELFSEQNYQGVTSAVIPSTVSYDNKTYAVTAIGDLAFNECTSLESITIPSSIIRIGESAFSMCTSLETVTIPGSVKRIENYAFGECSSLVSITMPNDIIIGYAALHNTQWYHNQADGVLYLGNALYDYKGDMPENTSVTIKDGTASISSHAFEDCYNLIDITVPNSVTYIGEAAFSDTKWYQNLPDGLVYLNNVLYACKGEYTPESHVEIKDGTVCISGYAFDHCDDMRSVSIPNTVKTIGASAFSYCYALETVNIPNSVTTIEESPFYDCTGLTTAIIGNNITYMDDYLFSGCTALCSVSFADGSRIIGNRAFYDCSALLSIELPNTITYIGEGAFYNCQSLREFTIPTGVKSLSDGVFASCTSLTDINLHNGMHTIGEGAFNGCTALTDITIPNSVIAIGREAFHGCSSLHSITIPEGIKRIDGDMFNGCPLNTVIWNAKHCEDFEGDEGYAKESPFESRYDYITSFTFGKSVEHIPGGLCHNLSGLTSINIPDNVTSIGALTFYGCSGLTEITIPENVKSIGHDAFGNCASLSSVVWNAKELETYDGTDDKYISILDWENIDLFTVGKSVQKIPNSIGSNVSTLMVEEGNAMYDSRNNCNAIIETATNTLIKGCKRTIIPEDIVHIGKNAFYNCDGITSITIPNSVETIAENAFSSCEDLANVDMKSGVKFIGDGAFGGCNMLSDISIPKTVSSIGKLAFTCGNLNSITIEEGNPVYDSRDNCNAIIETATNTLIVGCKNTIIPNSVTSIGEGAFSETGLTNITIPENVETIADGAFAHCEDLVSVEIKSGVKSIGYCAFVECEMLSEITIPNSVETIADYAFAFCVSLLKLNIEPGVKSIGNCAFAECEMLSEITIPNSVETIADEAFAECDLVEAINIGTGVKSIGEAAFACCENLKTVRCYAEVPPVIGEECFEEAYTASLLVLSDALTNYQNHEEWGKFENIKALTSEKVETDGVQVSPSIDEVTIVWPIESNADKYTIVIKKGTEVICTLDFDSEGMLLNIAFATSFNRSQSPVTRASSTGNGLSFTITGLENDEHYTYTITAKDSSSQTIQTYSGEFTTQRYTGIKDECCESHESICKR